MAQMRQTLARLITSSHILHHYDVLNEVGSISIRDPNRPENFVSSNLPAILITSPSDLEVRYVADASPVPQDLADITGAPGSTGLPNPEVFIHSSIYARYPNVMSIAHIVSTDLVVYGLCDANGSMLRCVSNQAGFVNGYSPIFDPALHRASLPIDHPETLRIDHPILGAALAEALNGPATLNGFTRDNSMPLYGIAFLRGNGAVIWSEELEGAVCKAVNVQRNAVIQTAAMLQRSDSDLSVTYLSGNESRDCSRVNNAAIHRSWRALATQTLRSALYRNDLEHSI